MNLATKLQAAEIVGPQWAYGWACASPTGLAHQATLLDLQVVDRRTDTVLATLKVWGLVVFLARRDNPTVPHLWPLAHFFIN